MKKIFLTGTNDKKPRREIQVDEFSYTVSTTSGESVITLPGGRTYTSDDYLTVKANGLKITSGVHYNRSSSTTITGVNSEPFPGGVFPDKCRLDFELYTTN